MNPHLSTSTILTVSEVNQRAKKLLEVHLSTIKIEGELSNLTTPSSGHWYFTLKDSYAQIRCTIFKSLIARVNFTPKEGDHLIVTGKISLYESRGDYQLIASTIKPAGEGTLKKAYLTLKEMLAREGVFDTKNKLKIPKAPARIALITSISGAAVFDVLTVLKRRSPQTEIDLYNTPVQGNDASKKIAQAIFYANRDLKTDVILLTRGGGSLEDLWCFNDESLARCIATSKIPIVSAVGHEIDFTLADFAADLRAATPSAAAEQLSLDNHEQHQKLSNYQAFFIKRIQQKLQQDTLLLSALKHRIQLPGKQLQLWHHQLADLTSQMKKNIQHILNNRQKIFLQTSQLLNTLNPLSTLSRGYSILHSPKGKTILSAQQVQPGQTITARLHKGQLTLKVIE